MESSTYFLMAWSALIVVLGVFKDRRFWLRKIYAGLLAIWMFGQLDAIDTAGVKATQIRVAEKRWNVDFRDGVLMTMQSVSSGQLFFKFGVLMMLTLAVLPPRKTFTPIGSQTA